MVKTVIFQVQPPPENAPENPNPENPNPEEEEPPTEYYRDLNQVTIKCPGMNIGDTFILDGIEYTKRARWQIDIYNAETTCTSGITDMSGLFFA
jgi:hypothetical protein